MTQTTKTMFIIGDTTYNESNGRYYKKTGDGKKTRISAAAYDAAAAEWVEMVKGNAERNAEQDEVDAVLDELNHEQNEANNFTNIGRKEIEDRKTEKSKLPKGFKIESNWDGDTTTYLVYKDGERLSAHWRYEDAVAAAVEAAKATPAEKPKKRKSKDIAHEFEGVTLTAKQVDFIKHLPDSDFWENLDSEIWVDCLCDEIGGQFKGKPMTVGAMISTLCEKKLGARCRQKVDGRMATSFKLTELGQKMAAELGVE